MKTLYANELEACLVAHAEHALVMFKFNIENSSNELEDYSRYVCANSFSEVNHYTTFADIVGSGLSNEAKKRLTEIQIQTRSIVDTWDKLKYRKQKVKRNLSFRDNKLKILNNNLARN